ncbi:flavin reductase family protein [Nocardia sp. NPDC004711]
MARQLDRDGGDYTLHYCVRNQARAAFAEELAGNPRVALHFDDGDPGQQLDLARDLGEPRPHTAIYVCGPGGFTDFVLDKARARGWPPHTLHTERFNTDPAPPASSGKQPGGFTVRVASSGAEYFVPEDRSVLDVLLDNGIDAPYSCQQGICGECAVRALHGILDHRDNVLTDSEHAEGLFTTCSSRVLSPLLELDL